MALASSRSATSPWTCVPARLFGPATHSVLPQQLFQLLATLIARRGALVTRNELRHELWPNDTFVDFEPSLNAAIRRLRDVLGNSAETPRYIETLPRRGYRFIAPVDDGPDIQGCVAACRCC